MPAEGYYLSQALKEGTLVIITDISCMPHPSFNLAIAEFMVEYSIIWYWGAGVIMLPREESKSNAVWAISFCLLERIRLINHIVELRVTSLGVLNK